MYSLTGLADHSSKFRYDSVTDKYYVEADTVHAYVPVRYEDKYLISIGNTVQVLGIFDYIVDKDSTHPLYGGLLLAAMLEMIPTQVNRVTWEDQPCYELYFKKGDVFINHSTYIKNDKLGYLIWTEFISIGNMPKFIQYDIAPFMFDRVSKTIDVHFGINHVIFEVLYAHLYRDMHNPSVKYRNSTMDKEPLFIGLRDIMYNPDDTLSRISGSYMERGLTAALVIDPEAPSLLEDIITA